MTKHHESLAHKLAAIEQMSRQALVGDWLKVHGAPPPKGVKRQLLERSAAWHLQSVKLGGHSKEVRHFLKQGVAVLLNKLQAVDEVADPSAESPTVLNGKNAGTATLTPADLDAGYLQIEGANPDCSGSDATDARQASSGASRNTINSQAAASPRNPASLAQSQVNSERQPHHPPSSTHSGYLTRGHCVVGSTPSTTQLRPDALTESHAADKPPIELTDDASAVRTPLRPALCIGSRLMREWNGRMHVVDVIEDGFAFDGKTYRSLSAIAKRITGTTWSGPRFFGVNQR